MRQYRITWGNDVKRLRSEAYNYDFDMRTGRFARWGRTLDDDPTMSPFGPEIVDMEISSGAGCPTACPFCYKGNTKGATPANMPLSRFREIFHKLPDTVTQIAFGITSVGSHPELFDIFHYCRSWDVIPNVTINGADVLTDEQIARLVDACGAIAISVVTVHTSTAYALIARFIEAGARQLNIHYVLSESTFPGVVTLCWDLRMDPRLRGVNAVVWLGLKPTGRGKGFRVLSQVDFDALVAHCVKYGIQFGFDSCSAPKFEAWLQSCSLPVLTRRALRKCSERCESGSFSAYIDVHGTYWPCSFSVGETNGIDLRNVKDFVNEVWLSETNERWRTRLLMNERVCPLYAV